jgi:hypothetical protein
MSDNDTSSGEVTPCRTPVRRVSHIEFETVIPQVEGFEPRKTADGRILIKAADDFSIMIIPPDTKSNFIDFNKPCEELDSEFLMQPVNEADYDSETQACVDARTGGPRSFYDHYVQKRRKKKGKRGCTVEGHHIPSQNSDDESEKESEHPRRAARVPPPSHLQPPKQQKQRQEPHNSVALKLTTTLATPITNGAATKVPRQNHDALMAPSTAVPQGSLNNVAVRRIACGRMPPEFATYNRSGEAKVAPPPQYEETTRAVNESSADICDS